jgi:trans-2,3-dihydro-3-hydroxyanthranilate isomerase
MECDISWVEVFAPRPLGGNLLPVLSPADGADDDVLQAVAARFRQPETSFVQTADDDRADYRHRIFTVDEELPFAGHPSLGTAAAVAARRGESRATYVQQTLSGLQSLDVELDGGHGVVTILQNDPQFGDEPDVTELLEAIGLDRGSLHPALRPQVVSTGLPSLIVPIADVEQLSRARPSVPALAQLLPSEGLDARTVYAVADAGDHWRARAFTPVVPIGEDAATGSAAGPFGAYLHRHRSVTTATVRQGVEIGSPSVLHTDTSDGVRVSGAVRIVGTGRHEIPAAG